MDTFPLLVDVGCTDKDVDGRVVCKEQASFVGLEFGLSGSRHLSICDDKMMVEQPVSTSLWIGETLHVAILVEPSAPGHRTWAGSGVVLPS